MGEERDETRPRERIERAAGRFVERRDAAAERMGERRDAAMERMGERRDAAVERMGERRDAAVEAMATARENVADAAATARENAADAVASAKGSAAEAIAKVKPRLRGVTHEWAFFTSLGLGAALIVATQGAKATIAVAIYAASLSALFGVSALYHRTTWRRPNVRLWMRRLDHAMIFFLIAGTVTPFALLVLEPPLATALLITVWAGALAGTVVELIWVDHPKWVAAIVYIAVGMIGAIGYPAIVAEAGIVAGILIAGGGALYMTGAIIYAAQRPDPNPAVFGYHEIFHVLVIAAAAAHFAAVAFFALPAG
jgi:hemolysin III